MLRHAAAIPVGRYLTVVLRTDSGIGQALTVVAYRKNELVAHQALVHQVERQLTDMPADYRRTLYWNPHLTLDQQGEATVTFYNCGRTTEPSASAQGQSPDGTLLWSE